MGNRAVLLRPQSEGDASSSSDLCRDSDDELEGGDVEDERSEPDATASRFLPLRSDELLAEEAEEEAVAAEIVPRLAVDPCRAFAWSPDGERLLALNAGEPRSARVRETERCGEREVEAAA